MVYVKPTVHFSRFANSALKSFTHGYAQTVVAASQSSYAAQNNTATDTLLGRRRKADKQKNAFHIDGARQLSTQQARPDASHDATLERYLDAWQKCQKNEGKEWHQYQFAKRIEWQPPTTVPESHAQTPGVETDALPQEQATETRPALMKRSYTTSAVNDFDTIFADNDGAEAALAQVADEITRTKEEESVASDISDPATPPSSLASSATSAQSVAEVWTDQLLDLQRNARFTEIPALFRSMLEAGVSAPTPTAYHALLTSVIHLTPHRQRVGKALEVYSDMLQRRIVPNAAVFSTLITLLSSRAIEALAVLDNTKQRLARYGAESTSHSAQLEHSMAVEDSSLAIALKIFARADSLHTVISDAACAATLEACARCGLIKEMNDMFKYGRTHALQTTFVPAMIDAAGRVGDLRTAVEVYDYYRDLAIKHNAGEAVMQRTDNTVYASLIKAYGSADRMKGGLKFLSGIQTELRSEAAIAELRHVVALQALLPLAFRDSTYHTAFDLVNSLNASSRDVAFAQICVHAADNGIVDVSTQAYNQITSSSPEVIESAIAMLAMHIRNNDVESAEPYWRIIESAPATVALIEPTVMRTIALVHAGQAERGLRQARRIFSRVREVQPESRINETVDQIAEAIEVTGNVLLHRHLAVQPEASAELLRAMVDNGGLVLPLADHLLARLGPEQIARLSSANIELILRIQAGLIMHETSADIAGPARFACLLKNIVAKSIVPSADTETILERTLINLDKTELSRLWNNYRYPPSPLFGAAAYMNSPVAYSQRSPPEDTYDPYMGKTDVKGSNMINDLLERPQGRRVGEALTKFRNMRRVGRVPRMFTYGKLIESVAKENNLNLAHEILAMAKQDVPYDPQYRVVRFGWQQILDHMVAGCLTMGRRDLAAQFHRDLADMGAAPSANTFGLYITTLKANTKTFDEASEAVKIFQQAKAEGVEPTSFLYNALIGKLGKARRIDDCLFYFAEMRNLGVRPTSVTYGTVVNALCRVSDDKFAEEIFEEMEACTNYKPRPAPYHSLMQFFLTTKRDRAKVLAYYERMRSKNIEPTVHTFKLLIDAHATLEPVNMPAAQLVLEDMKACGIQPEAVHYAALVHAQGCVLHDVAGARKIFDDVVATGAIRLQPCLYQAMFESFNANHKVAESDALLADMNARHIEYTAYIANALIHGWTMEKDIVKARAAFDRVNRDNREPSTYEAMVRAYLAVEQRDAAKTVVREALGRGYPSAVAGKISELVH